MNIGTNAKKSIERADLDALLKRLSELDGFFPSLITHEDKPDFILTVANRMIGVEATRSDAEEYFRALDIQVSKHPSRWINTTHFKNRSPQRTNNELAESMGYNATSQTWKPVNEVMFDWNEKIRTALNLKRGKFNQTDFRKFDENWLLIHNHRPLVNDEFTQQSAGQLLNDLFLEASEIARDFDTIFVHSGVFLFRWQRGELCLA